ncbi:MAG: Rrf2 family transcriptional regulator [Verrucomicrobiales bacterium]|jgi:Rrf2 family cysteine metabolism transcriptional repressor|nr:Rrf2 family transcriptional regulator [Verrucomicrobiales bacterium]HQZ26813.1 Rrf2 family transcriptional regulator [Verrucomicrobiales bacterium]
MRLPLKTEYACQVLAQLASTYAVGEVRQVEELAAAEGLSPNYLVQILTTLRGAGLVISRRGKYGGYLLARHPETITLAEIAAAMEGGVLIESSPGNGGKSAEKVREAWIKVNEAMMESCRQIPLTELIPPYVPLEGTDWVF